MDKYDIIRNGELDFDFLKYKKELMESDLKKLKNLLIIPSFINDKPNNHKDFMDKYDYCLILKCKDCLISELCLKT